MRSDYDSKANSISIELEAVDTAERADQVHDRAIVALRDGHPVELQILYPNLGLDEPLKAVAGRYGLDHVALAAAAAAALAAPDRIVDLDLVAVE